MPYWRLSGFYFFYFALLGVWVPFWPLYMQSIGYGAFAIGICSAVFQGTRVVAPFLWGYLSDKTGKRLLIIQLGCLLGFLCFLFMFFDKTLGFIMAVLAIFSFFWSAVLPQFEVLTIEHLRDKPENYSNIRLWGSVGFIATAVILGGYFEWFPMSHFLGWIAAVLFALLLISLTVPDTVKLPTSSSDNSSDIASPLFSKPVIWFLLCVIVNQMSYGPYLGFYSLLTAQAGFSTTTLGLFWMLAVSAEIVLFSQAGRLLREFSLGSLLLVSTFAGVMRWLVFALWPELIAAHIVGQLLHALNFALFHTLLIENVRRLFSKRQQGRGQAVFNALGYGLGAVIGVGASGILWDSLKSDLFFVAALISFLSVVLAYRFILVNK